MNRTIRCAHCRCLVLAESPGEDATFLLQQGSASAREKPSGSVPTLPPILITGPANEIANTTGSTSIPSTGASIANSVPTTARRNRLLQQHRDHKRRGRALAKMEVSKP